jgi:hypothetical protein
MFLRGGAPRKIQFQRFDRPIEGLTSDLALVTTAPDLVAMLGGMATGWSSNVEDLELVARLVQDKPSGAGPFVEAPASSLG